MSREASAPVGIFSANCASAFTFQRTIGPGLVPRICQRTNVVQTTTLSR